ncbi:hypothetical protein CAL23_18550 [Bordetella genomosp. 6]|uniref:Uncharacterized protein n=1 Tax=Bordetella genomosp. 6 TaxID=463024 RepID=A0ABX4F9E7_9BORD|nr:hypothetical protein CAL23_18550 [Bordetella genomosp. 6]
MRAWRPAPEPAVRRARPPGVFRAGRQIGQKVVASALTVSPWGWRRLPAWMQGMDSMGARLFYEEFSSV